MGYVIDLPSDLGKKMKVEDSYFYAGSHQFGIVVLSHIEQEVYNVHFYELKYNPEEELYNVYQDLASFSFHDEDTFNLFLKKIPTYTGLDMLLLLHPSPQSQYLLGNH